MESRQSSFEEHINIVESAHSKTAGDKNAATDSNGESLLDKIATELNLGKEQKKEAAEGSSVTAPAAPTAEGEVHPADSSVAGAAPAVASATEAVATPQTAIAGGNPAEAAAGEVPAPTKPNEGLAISAGDGKVLDANNLHKTPEAVAAAAEGGGGDEGSAATPSPEKDGAVPDQSVGAEKTAEAEKIGQMIAESFQKELGKKAEAQEYIEAIEILKEAGLLEKYTIKDENMEKKASHPEGCLEKIAENKPLSREELIGAAHEYVELQKEAEAAEEQGREDARNLVALVADMQKKASDGETPAPEKTEENKEEKTESEKIAAAINDEAVVTAVKVLKDKGIL